ncbi:hypothetical protein [Marinobacter sp. LV10R510-11A]|nr:hypothetical protein [Marinobacter sp. LV10R510-11A]
MASQTNEQALEASIEKFLTGWDKRTTSMRAMRLIPASYGSFWKPCRLKK